ncbi:MAG: hypothetical protein JJU29_01890 [Verrucomicrobia bacterium]|nr:hypothetical protein [Verrucomicrobiota bacterium]MCH8510985.1 hypothetical protein [Kiritimatiellia bacterium]
MQHTHTTHANNTRPSILRKGGTVLLLISSMLFWACTKSENTDPVGTGGQLQEAPDAEGQTDTLSETHTSRSYTPSTSRSYTPGSSQSYESTTLQSFVPDTSLSFEPDPQDASMESNQPNGRE